MSQVEYTQQVTCGCSSSTFGSTTTSQLTSSMQTTASTTTPIIFSSTASTTTLSVQSTTLPTGTTASTRSTTSTSAPTTASILPSTTQQTLTTGPTQATLTTGPTVPPTTQRTFTTGPTVPPTTQRTFTTGPTQPSTTQRTFTTGPTPPPTSQPTFSSGITTSPTIPPEFRPTLFCPPDALVSCDQSTDPSVTGFPMLLNCPGVVPTYTDVRQNQQDNCTASPCGVIERTWSAIGCPANPNEICCKQLIEIAELTAPVIQCPPSVSVACGEPTSPYQLGFPTGTSQCPPVSFTFTQNASAAVCHQVIARQWTVTSACNRTSVCIQEIVVGPNIIPPTVPPTLPPGCDCTKSSPWCPDPVCESQEPGPSTTEPPHNEMIFTFEGLFEGAFGEARERPATVQCVMTPFGKVCR